MDVKATFENLCRQSRTQGEAFIKKRIREDYYSKELRQLYASFLLGENRKTEADRILGVPHQAKLPVRLATRSLDQLERESHNSVSAIYNIFPAEKFTVARIENKACLPKPALEHPVLNDEGREINLDDTKVYQFEGGYFSRNGAFFTQDNYYLSDNRMSHGAFLRGVYFDPKYSWHKDLEDEYSHVDQPCLVIQKHPVINYYHFLIEQAPNLLIFNALRNFGVRAKPFYIKSKFERLHFELLSLLTDFGNSDVLVSNTYLTRLSKALRPNYSDLASTNCFITPKLRRFSEALKGAVPKDGEYCAPRKIFITRRDAAGKRAILNESEIISVLEKQGFEVVDLAGRSVSDQVSLFRSASIVVAGHGAGLANTIFCPKGTRVIELTHTYNLNRLRIFWDIASYFDLQFNVVCSVEKIEDNSASFTIPVADLLDTLDL